MSPLVIIVVLAALAGGGIWLKRRSDAYGGLKASFSSDLKDDRRDLAGARKLVAQLEAQRDAELSAAAARVQTAKANYARAVGDAKDHLAYLKNPTGGSVVAELGPVTLRTHEVNLNGQPIGLTGISADARYGATAATLLVRLANGQTYQHSFSTAEYPVGKPEYKERYIPFGPDVIEQHQKYARDFSDEQVLWLANTINNQAIWHNEFITTLPAKIPAAEAAIVDAEAATGPVDQAEAAAAQVRAGTNVSAQLDEAKAALSAQESLYQDALRRVAAAKP